MVIALKGVLFFIYYSTKLEAEKPKVSPKPAKANVRIKPSNTQAGSTCPSPATSKPLMQLHRRFFIVIVSGV